jgi:ArsR family transcriptional regulator
MRDTAEFFRVLADEARLKMLWLLFNNRELCVCDFVEVLGITQSKASRHLRILYQAGLVTDRRDGLWVYYSLRPLEPGLAKGHLAELQAHLAVQPAAVRLLGELSAWRARKGEEARHGRKLVSGSTGSETVRASTCCPGE